MTDEASGEIRHVTDTAFLVAQYRANESTRPDALFSDPLAGMLAGDKGKALAAASPVGPITGWILAVRTVVIDALINGALELGVDTIVNLGAGLDARPYRLALPPQLTWIEVDFPEMIDYKVSLLAGETPRCRLEHIAVDLGDDEARRQFLAELESRSEKILVLTEGVIPYLSNDQVSALAADLHSMKNVRYWIADYFSEVVHRWREQRGVSDRMREAPFLFRPGDWFEFFRQRGWRVHTIRYLMIEGKRIGRPFPVPRRARSFRMMLMYALRPKLRQRLARSMGFAMLEPTQKSADSAISFD
ncbi:MAG: class I SAM-dependent methyltransferase [Gemmatimonadaceae bacterium]